ncbi:MAG: type IV pilus assembly protein PilM [Patescibacteria group bacterium]|nr:type IV pilus assembly protein PilM [Patescibacteria group bacterium]
MIFLKKQNFALGLDISNSYLRAAQSKTTHDKIKLQALAMRPLNEKIIQNQEIKDPDALVKKIGDLLAKPQFGSFNTTEVVAKLPSTATYVKYIALENTPNNLSDTVANEIEKHIPMTKKEMYYDFQLIKRQDNVNHILLGAAPRAIVDQYVAILKAVKLEVSALEINSVCDCRSLLLEEKMAAKTNKVYALINIGFNASFLTVYAQGTIVFSISMPLSGQDATDKIAETLKIKPKQAEKAKIICGMDKSQADGIVFDILSKMIENLSTRIKSVFEYISTHYPEYSQINEILLYGKSVNIKNLDTFIAKKFNISTRIASPLLHFDDNEAKLVKTLNKDEAEVGSLSGFTSVVGLSLRKIFLKQE